MPRLVPSVDFDSRVRLMSTYTILVAVQHCDRHPNRTTTTIAAIEPSTVVQLIRRCGDSIIACLHVWPNVLYLDEYIGAVNI